MSANLCEAIVEMMPSPEDAALRIGSSWSPVLPAPRDVPTSVLIERQYGAAIEQVARALRPGTLPTSDLYIGKIDGLQGEPGADGRVQGEVVLAAQVEDTIVHVRLDLGPDDYQRAGDTHLKGRYVSVRGILHRGARVHRIEESTSFTVLDG